MRIEISKESADKVIEVIKVIEVPADVDMASIMTRSHGWMQWGIVCFEAEWVSRQEEEIFSYDSKQVFALYYRAPELAEVMQAFVGYEGMKYVEVMDGEYRICMIV